MKAKAIQVNQAGQISYVTSLPISELIDEQRYTIERWTADNKDKPEAQGYQRQTNPKHRRDIGRFFAGETKDVTRVLPAAVVLNSRRNIEAQEIAKGVYELDLGSTFELYVVDGQHRIAGGKYAIESLKNAGVGNYELPVVITQMDKFEEVWTFRSLNSKAAKVPTDYSQRLIYDLARGGHYEMDADKEAWLATALTTTDVLNESVGSLWHGRIGLPGQKRDIITVKQNSFVQSLKPLIKGTRLEDYREGGELATIIDSYWRAIRRVWPKAFVEPKKNVIQQTTGVFTMHMLLEDIVKRPVALTENEFFKILSSVRDNAEGMTDGFWRKDNMRGASSYGSMKGFSTLRKTMFLSVDRALLGVAL